MAKKQHVLLVNPVDHPIQFKYKSRKLTPRIEDEEKDYRRMADRFEQNARDFVLHQAERIRNRTLTIPLHLDYIEIRFQDQFDITKFGRSYLRDFGLDAVKFSEFNRKILFAISDVTRFQTFLPKIRAFILFGRGDEQVTINTVDKRMLYIHDFSFFTSTKIKQFNVLNTIVRLSLLESLDSFNIVNQLETSLDQFLRASNQEYFFDRPNNCIEIINPDQDVIDDVIANFDIVFSATSSLSTIIQPTRYQLPQRDYGFTISNADEDLPLIGIIDTGIDQRTPLSSIIVGTIDKTSTNARTDNENHGTAVAALAAMGKRPYLTNYRGSIRADAKLLSLKVMNTSPAPLPDEWVIDVILEAKRDFPSVKLFVLTISYEQHRQDNQLISDYAYRLDKLAYELDVLLFISTANNEDAPNQNRSYDLDYFNNTVTNLCTPAESRNNITVGACADNMIPGTFHGSSPLKEFPALYSRRDCHNQHEFFSPRKINKHLRKPDVLLPGGDYEVRNNFMGTGELATMEVLSSDPTESFYKNVGTSYASPLAANMAARISKLYPNIRSQSIKALLINASSGKLIASDNHDKLFLSRIAGYGIPHDDVSQFSHSNAVTFLVEQQIKHKDLIAIPIALPNYLRTVTKRIGLLKITATLCFNFLPQRDNQLAYCPIFIAFSFFKNKTVEQIKSEYADAVLRKSWSQDGYSQAKPILYSNVQKMDFSIGRQDIVDENGVIKVAVHCMVSPQIKATILERRDILTQSYKFSLAIRIEEIQAERNLTNRLYNDIIAINDVQNIGTIDLQNDLEIE